MSKMAVKTKVSKKYVPDQLYVDISVKAYAPSHDECISAHDQIVDRALRSLELAGFRKEDVKDSLYRASPEHEWVYAKDDGNYYRHHKEIVGYCCSSQKTLAVPMADDAQGRAWAALASCGDDVSFNIGYGLADSNAAEEALLNEAVTAARRKAQAIAAASGCKLGKVLLVNFGDDSDFGGFSYLGVDKCELRSLPLSSAPCFNPEEIEVECEVYTEWELIPE